MAANNVNVNCQFKCFQSRSGRKCFDVFLVVIEKWGQKTCKMVSEMNYRRICAQLGSTWCDEATFNRLKEHFRQKINSRRRLERVQSVGELVTLLEKRDELGPQNEESLRYLCQGVGVRFEQPNNHYFGAGIHMEDQNRVIPQVPQDAEGRINKLLRDELGRSWKEFARNLSISEGKIDNIVRRYYNDLPEMINECLRFHKENCGMNYTLWRVNLQKALEKARRNDLKNRVDQILIWVPNGVA